VSPDAAVLLAVVGLPFVGAALVPVVYRALGERTAYFAAAIAAVCFALLASQTEAALHAAPDAGAVVIPWIPALGVDLALYLDGLSLLIGFLASGVGVLVFTYSAGYMHQEPGKQRYYATLLAFMGSMLGVALAADLIALFVFWELTSVTSFLLIGHYRTTDAGRYAARKSMFVTVVGGLFLLVGVVLLAHVTGQAPGLARTFTLVGTEGSMLSNAGSVRGALETGGLFVPVVALVVVGAAAKSAQVPLQIWLPDAMEAPTPVSAFLHSATMVKAGVYLVGRLRPLFLPPDVAVPEWTLLVATLGLVSMAVTAVLAVGATDMKELLAYSTASHLGLIIAGYGLANEAGVETGAFHIVNHALFKAALFLVAGIVAHEAGTRAIHELGGLAEHLPVTTAVTVVAALGMAGVPPFNGFYSKELLFEATWTVAAHEGGVYVLYPAVAVFGSVFTFLYSIRFLLLFFGEEPDALADREIHAPPWSMLAPTVLLGVLAALVGLGGVLSTVGVHVEAFEAFLASVVGSSAVVEGHGFEYHVPTTLTPYVAMSLLTIGVGAVLYPFYGRLHRGVRRLRAVPYTSPDAYYDAGIDGLDRLGALVPRYVQTDVMRTYAAVVLVATSLLVLGGYAAAGVGLPAFDGFVVGLPIALVLLVAVVGAGAVGTAPSHVAGVLTLSILGFMVAVFYVLASAPDLALTQLVIETLVLFIFLLVLDRLPAFYGEATRLRALADGLVAGLVGVTVFLTVLLATAGTPDDRIAEFFVENGGVPGEHGPVITDAGGGGNIVNVILVDFRAFDTLGEISVVAMAALSVLTLIAMRGRGESHE
jgi:multicomponent Na+:H+ antiporter subunit A